MLCRLVRAFCTECSKMGQIWGLCRDGSVLRRSAGRIPQRGALCCCYSKRWRGASAEDGSRVPTNLSLRWRTEAYCEFLTCRVQIVVTLCQGWDNIVGHDMATVTKSAYFAVGSAAGLALISAFITCDKEE